MTTPAPAPKPKRSRRMVVWMIAVPIVILLLALAGANWKFFHLAYAKHLIASDDHKKQDRGIDMVLKTHLRKEMSVEEVRRLFEPARLTEPAVGNGRGFTVLVKGRGVTGCLDFDENERLYCVVAYYDDVDEVMDIPLGGK